MSIGVGNSWLIDAGVDLSGVNTYGVVPNDIVGGNLDLTLSGPTDLAYFRVGDAVQAAQLTTAAGFAIATSSTGADVDYPDTNAGDKVEIYKSADLDMTSTVEQTLPDGIISATRFTHLVFDLIDETSDFTFSLDATNWRVYSSVNGSDWVSEANVDQPADLSVRSLFDPSRRTSRYAMISYIPPSYSWKDDYNAKITLNQAYVDAFAAPHQPSQIPGFAEDSITIVSIDDTVPSITVDGGEWAGTDGSGNGGWNQSQVWSSICTYVNGNTSRPLSLFFNGQLDQELYALSRKRATITFPSVVPATTGEIYGKINGATDSQWILEINGVEVTQGSDNDWTSIDTALAVEGGLKTISFGDNGSGTYPHIYGIKLDGKLLVDQGIAGAPIPGDPEVTCVSPLKAPTDWTIEGIDTDNNQLSLSHATPDDNAQVWVANDNQSGTDFYVTGPQIVDEPLLTADVELESSLFTTTPPGVDTLRNIVWEVNGVEQDAGTTNPYKPTGLTINTNYTVRVKHQGNTLDESPWSDQTTFTTGATRNLYTYYNERVEALVARIEALENP